MMRTFLIVLLLGGISAGVYYYFWASPADAPPTAALGELEQPRVTTSSAPIVDPTPSPPPAPPAPNEENQLRRQLADARAPDLDSIRFRLAELLLLDLDRSAEGVMLLQQITQGAGDGGGEIRGRALSLLFDRASTAGEKSELATAVLRNGEAAPAFARSAYHLGAEAANAPEDSRQTRAWELLSRAYFASQDEAWRSRVRPTLQKLVQNLVLSTRMTSAAVNYTVVSGDSFGEIARRHKTTIDSIKWINNKSSDVIHPGDRLKILTGEVTIEVDKSDYRLDVRLDGKFLFSAAVGLGLEGRTPLGEFTVELKQEKPNWHKPGQKSIPNDHPDNPLGSCWIGFKNTPEYSGYGIHGTREPDSIGKESSQGCIRLLNEDVQLLYRLTPTGTKVTIRE
ncbi:MAG: L,D-transpeptidase family protein [Planctomycetota bacterium]